MTKNTGAVNGHNAFVNGHIEPSVDFDYDVLDGSHLAPFQPRTPEERELVLVEKFTRAVAQIYDARNSKKSALCFLIATGSAAAQGRKILSAAREFGVSKQDISKCCVAWCEYLGIPPSSYMRKEATKQSFRISNKRKT